MILPAAVTEFLSSPSCTASLINDDHHYYWLFIFASLIIPAWRHFCRRQCWHLQSQDVRFSTAIFDVICPIATFNINCNTSKLAPVPQLPGDLALVAGLAGVGGVQLVPHLRARLSLEETLVDNSLTALEWTMMIWLPSAWRTLCTPRKQKPRNVSLSTPDIFFGMKNMQDMENTLKLF